MLEVWVEPQDLAEGSPRQWNIAEVDQVEKVQSAGSSWLVMFQ